MNFCVLGSCVLYKLLILEICRSSFICIAKSYELPQSRVLCTKLSSKLDILMFSLYTFVIRKSEAQMATLNGQDRK